MALSFQTNADSSVNISMQTPNCGYSTSSHSYTYPGAGQPWPWSLTDNNNNNISFPASTALTYYGPVQSGTAFLICSYGPVTGANIIQTFSMPIGVRPVPVLVNGQTFPGGGSTLYLAQFVAATVNGTVAANAFTDPRAAQGIYCYLFMNIQFQSATVSWFVDGGRLTGTAPAPPSPPTNLQILSQVPQNVTLSWNPSTPGSAPIQQYNIFWGTSNGGPYYSGSQVSSTNSITIPASQFTPNTTYYFVVNAQDNGTGGVSAISDGGNPGTNNGFFPGASNSSGSAAVTGGTGNTTSTAQVIPPDIKNQLNQTLFGPTSAEL